MRIAGPSRNIRSARPLCGDDGAAEESKSNHIKDHVSTIRPYTCQLCSHDTHCMTYCKAGFCTLERFSPSLRSCATQMRGKQNIWVGLFFNRRSIMLSHVWDSPASQNWPVCRHSLDFPHWWMSCLTTENKQTKKTCQWLVNIHSHRWRCRYTFEQQRHEWDVRRTEFGHCQSVGPVVTWGILNGGTTAHHYITS